MLFLSLRTMQTWVIQTYATSNRPWDPGWRFLKAVCISEGVSRPVVCNMSLLQRGRSKVSLLIGIP